MAHQQVAVLIELTAQAHNQEVINLQFQQPTAAPVVFLE
jgi:hypothetical protein